MRHVYVAACILDAWRIRAGRGNCKITGSAATRVTHVRKLRPFSSEFRLAADTRIINLRPDLTATDNFLDNYGGEGRGKEEGDVVI